MSRFRKLVEHVLQEKKSFWADYDLDKDDVNESIQTIQNGVKLIKGTNDMVRWLQNNHNSRIIYDVEKDWYIVSNNLKEDIHVFMIEDAVASGLYPEYSDLYEKKIRTLGTGEAGVIILDDNRFECCISYDKNDAHLQMDPYKNRYDCGNIVIFDSNGDFEYMPIYDELLKETFNITESSSYTIDNIKIHEDPSVRWMRNQLDKGIELRVLIDGDLNEPYFGSWTVWNAYDANHNTMLKMLGSNEDDYIQLKLKPDDVMLWGYSKEQIKRLKECDKLNELYPDGYGLLEEW